MPSIASSGNRKTENVALVIGIATPLLAIMLKLVPALLSGLLIYVLVRTLAPRLEAHLSSHGARVAMVAVLALVVTAAIAALTVAAIAFLHSDAGSLPALMKKMAEIIDSSRASLPGWVTVHLPSDSSTLQGSAAGWLREHAGELQKIGAETLRAIAHAALGMVVGALLALRETDAGNIKAPLAHALAVHAGNFATAFRRVVFAQVQIAAINATLTGLYLVIGLELFGIHLPLAKTMVALTFVTGLLPVIGNLISNTAIVILSLSHSLDLALMSLVFLVVVHKLEYFLNAKIVGNHIRSHSWELLLAMLVMEALFGLGGLVLAPIYYAYLKNELAARGLV